ncbi:MAG TPA: PAS domain S-box protein, partial [Candidatus Acidoferrum sp.]
MPESPKWDNYLPVEASIPDSTVSLESILCTEELRRRPSRLPDYEKENRALVALLGALLDSHPNILQTLADTILDVIRCDSSGVSLLTKEDGGKRFYWPAIAGMWRPHIGGGTPRDFGTCGDVLDRNCTLLFKNFERRYPYFLPVTPLIEECLLVPFYVGGKAVGTIWAITHSDRRKFDAEDERLMNTLGQFASLAYQTLESIEDLKLQVTAREKAEAALRQLASGLEAKIRRLVGANIIGIIVFNIEGQIIEANEAFLRMVGYSREDLLSGRVRWTDLTPAEWRDCDERAVAQLKATGIAQPFQKEYFRKDGSRVPVLVGGAMFEGSGNEGVAFVLDLSEQKHAEDERNRAEQAVLQAQAELAHVTRVTTLGELAASIAHEINQPLAAMVTNANASLRWLSGDSPNLDEACEANRRIIRDGNRG